jgi:hypothetical protein
MPRTCHNRVKFLFFQLWSRSECEVRVWSWRQREVRVGSGDKSSRSRILEEFKRESKEINIYRVKLLFFTGGARRKTLQDPDFAQCYILSPSPFSPSRSHTHAALTHTLSLSLSHTHTRLFLSLSLSLRGTPITTVIGVPQRGEKEGGKNGLFLCFS